MRIFKKKPSTAAVVGRVAVAFATRMVMAVGIATIASAVIDASKTKPSKTEPAKA